MKTKHKMKTVIAMAMAAAVALSGVPTMAATDAQLKDEIVTADTVDDGIIDEAVVLDNEVNVGDLQGEVVTSVKSAAEAVYAYSLTGSGLWIHTTTDLTTTNHLYLLGAGHGMLVNQTMENGSWIQVIINYNGCKYGYIYNDPTLVEMRKEYQEDWQRTDQYEAVVNSKNGLNVHSVAGLEYSCLGTLPNGASVPVVAISSNWVEIKYRNNRNMYVEGYVSRQYVNLVDKNASTEQPDSPIKKLTGYNVYVKTNGTALKVHTSPSMNSAVLRTIPCGSMATAIGQSDNWREIRYYYNGQFYNGFVYRPYTVLAKYTGSVRFSARNFSLKVGNSKRIGFLGVRRDMVTQTKWKSKNTSIATVNASGYITAKRKGTATIVGQYYVDGAWRTYSTKVYCY